MVELLNAVVCTSQKWYPTFKVGQASTLTLETDTWSYTLEVGEDSLSFETPDYGSYCLYVEPESVEPLLELLRGERELHPDPAPYQFEVERVLYAVLQDSEKRVVLSREEDSEASRRPLPCSMLFHARRSSARTTPAATSAGTGASFGWFCTATAAAYSKRTWERISSSYPAPARKRTCGTALCMRAPGLFPAPA